MSDPTNYHGGHGTRYEVPNRRGFLSVHVLPELIGKPWDKVALAYCHSLRPDCIRVSRSELKTDAWLWRVTVMVDDHGIIREITQEVEVGLPDDCRHGYDLWCTLHGHQKPVPMQIDGRDVYGYTSIPNRNIHGTPE